MLLVVPAIGNDAIHYLGVAVISFQRRRSVTVGVVGLRVNLGAHPAMEVGELLPVACDARYARSKPRFQIEIEAGGVVHGHLRGPPRNHAAEVTVVVDRRFQVSPSTAKDAALEVQEKGCL